MIFHKLVGFCLLLIVGVGCTKESAYHEVVEQELAKGVRQDSLFLGFFFGMTQEQFFARCWKLNQQKLLKEGSSNTTIEYVIQELRHPARMNFFPDFHEGKIWQMPVTVSYDAWAPWNKELFADSLQLDVLAWYEKTYGEGFIKIEHPKQGAAYVKVDGNRRISIFKDNDAYVNVLFTDLMAEKEIKRKEIKR